MRGENRFEGWGAFQNIRRLVERWSQPEHPKTLEAALEEFSSLEWQGSWEIRELDSLAQFSPALAEALRDVVSTGR